MLAIYKRELKVLFPVYGGMCICGIPSGIYGHLFCCI